MAEPRRREYLKLEALEDVRRSAKSSEPVRILNAAVEKYQRYLSFEENRDDDDAWASLGGAYRRLGEVDKAIESYRAAYSLSPESTYALVNLISLLAARQRSGDKELLAIYNVKAQQLFRMEIDAGRADHWTWYDLATLQLIDGQIEDSRASFAYAAERTPKDATENFRSVLSNLNFLRQHQPAMPGLSEAIEFIQSYLH